jgi:predicted phosphoadenosine phosphosulfate sulfurtransferase
MNKIYDFYLVAYNNSKGEQICKPFFDDENGTLKLVAVFNVYRKIW